LAAVHVQVHGQVPLPPLSPDEQRINRLVDIYWLAGRVVQLLLPLALLFSGQGARLCRWISACVRGSRFLTAGLFGCAYALLNALISLPIDYARHYRLPKSLGWLENESLGQWFAEQALGLVPVLVAAVLLLWIPYALMRRSPRRWWLWAMAAVAPVALFFLVVQPVWIKPLTTRYETLADVQLRASIDQLASRCGLSRVPVVVGGTDTAVYGLGPTVRIFLQDDLSKENTPAQIRFTIAHELKHYVMGDNWQVLPIVILLAFAGFWLTYRIGRWSMRRLHAQFGFTELEDPASLPLLVVCMTALWLTTTPIFLLYNRHIEREADRFALELSHENEAAAQLFASWAKQGTDWVQPDGFALAFYYTHPSIAERMELANSYHPWLQGEPLRYADACSMPIPAAPP
jgi:Zn-dependent protease with chaperone function